VVLAPLVPLAAMVKMCQFTIVAASVKLLSS
jgi:hypothetical protein